MQVPPNDGLLQSYEHSSHDHCVDMSSASDLPLIIYGNSDTASNGPFSAVSTKISEICSVMNKRFVYVVDSVAD